MSDTVEKRTGRSEVSRYRRSSQSRFVMSPLRKLAARPPRRPLVEKGAQTLDTILGCKHGREGLDLVTQARRQIALHRGARRALRLAERHRSAHRQLAGEGRRL